MIQMLVVFIALTLIIALISGAWSASNEEEKTFVLKLLAKGAIFAGIATGILFVIVNLF
jgi:hypothetical protein